MAAALFVHARPFARGLPREPLSAIVDTIRLSPLDMRMNPMSRGCHSVQEFKLCSCRTCKWTVFAIQLSAWVRRQARSMANRNCGLAKDFERTIKSATALLYAAAAIVLIRRIARYASDSRQALRQASRMSDVDIITIDECAPHRCVPYGRAKIPPATVSPKGASGWKR